MSKPKRGLRQTATCGAHTLPNTTGAAGGTPTRENAPETWPAGGRASRRGARWLAFLAGLLFSACMILAFAPFSLWGFSLVAIAPLVWLVERLKPASTRVKREPGVTSEQPQPAPSPRRGFGRRGEGSHAPGANHDPSHPAPNDQTVPAVHAPGSSIHRPLAIALFAAAGTIPFHLFEHWWLWPVAGPGVPLVVLILTLYPLAFVWILLRLQRRWPRVPTLLAAPILWTGLEFFRGHIAFDGYPWYFVGHPLIDFRWLAQSATAIGAIGVSAAAALAGTALGWIAASPTPRRFGAAAATLAAAAIAVQIAAFPALLTRSSNEPIQTTLRVGVVQTNLAQTTKMDWPPAERIDDLLWFLEMTEEAARSGTPDLIVWPETMFPGSSLDEQARQAERDARIVWNIDTPGGREQVPVGAIAETLLDRQRALGIPMLIGATGFDNVRYEPRPSGGVERYEDAIYNSVFAIADGRVVGRYDKVHLTPGGEVMPYISAWPWLERQMLGLAAAGMTFDLSAGDRPRVLSVPTTLAPPPVNDSDSRGRFAQYSHVALATPVCFESTDAALCRRLVSLARGGDGWGNPTLLVNPTNDGWFGDSVAGRRQHLQLARWRAVENRVAVVRAANTGISCAIDHHGRVYAHGVRGPDDRPGFRGPDALSEGILVAEVPLVGGRTLYSLLGDWLGWGLMWAALAGAVATFWPGGGQRAKDSGQRPSKGR
jgi:apolipoprotein N-acyltransferase